MGYAKVMIVDDDGQHVGGGAVRSQQNHVVELAVGHFNSPLDPVLDDGCSLKGSLEADNRVHARRRFRWIPVAPPAVV